MENEGKPKYPITNILIVLFLTGGIVTIIINIYFLVIVAIMDVAVLLGIVSVRNFGSEVIPSIIFLAIGILFVTGELVDMIVASIPIDWDTFLLALYFMLMGVIFIINRWERDRA